MSTESPLLAKITEQLKQLQDRHAMGDLLLRTPKPSEPPWLMHFYLGRLVFATGGHHRVRRWYRLLHRHCPDLEPADWVQSTDPDASDPLECQIIHKLVRQGKITAEQSKAVLQGSTQEVFYTLLDRSTFETHWRPVKHLPQPLALLPVQQILQYTLQQKTKWQEAGLALLQNMIPNFSPDFSPLLVAPDKLKAMADSDAISQDTYKNMLKMLNGSSTLWDLSYRMQRSLISVTRSILPLTVDGIVELREIPDLPPLDPNDASYDKPSQSVKTRGSIACIDDSPLIGEEIARILQPLGYEVFKILDPLQGVSQLLSRKPDLIFLDLVMPNTNGYELCTFLRKTTAFQDIPIVILTGRDGVVDRVRAKIAGASDFMGKPPEASKVTQIVEKYLEKSPPS